MQAIGVVGPIASGKGTALDLLRDRGFMIYSLSDTLRELAALSRFDPTRELLQDLGDLYRKHGGDGRLAELTLERIPSYHRTYLGFDSIRNPGEIRALRSNLDIKILGVDADPQRRFKWMLDRNRPGDPIDFDEFQRLQTRDLGVGQTTYGQQVQQCLDAADFVIQNDGTKEELRAEAEAWFRSIGLEGQPPFKETR